MYEYGWQDGMVRYGMGAFRIGSGQRRGRFELTMMRLMWWRQRRRRRWRRQQQ